MCRVRSSIVSTTISALILHSSICSAAVSDTTWESTQLNSSSVSFTYTPSPSTPDVVFIFCIASIAGQNTAKVTGATYGGTSATQVGSNAVSTTGGNNGDIAVFYYDNSSGTKDGNQVVACSRSDSGQFAIIVVGYTGTGIVLPPSYSSAGSSSNVSSLSVTVTGLDADYTGYDAIAGIYSSESNVSGVTAGTGFTKNLSAGTGAEDLGTRVAVSMYDENNTTGSTTHSCSFSTGSNESQALFCLVVAEEVVGRRRRFISN